MTVHGCKHNPIHVTPELLLSKSNSRVSRLSSSDLCRNYGQHCDASSFQWETYHLTSFVLVSTKDQKAICWISGTKRLAVLVHTKSTGIEGDSKEHCNLESLTVIAVRVLHPWQKVKHVSWAHSFMCKQRSQHICQYLCLVLKARDKFRYQLRAIIAL